MTSPDPTDDHLVIEPSVLYVGTPVLLLSTVNDDGTPNLAPASSHWALERMLVLGLETDGQTARNLGERPELTVNFPSGDRWEAVERLAAVTGRDPVPDAKAAQYAFEPAKFDRAGLTPQASDLIAPPRVRECPLQFEAVVRRMTPGVAAGYLMVEAEVVRVHALPEVVVSGTDHIDPHAWRPLIYSFRHYFDRGPSLGWTRKSPTPGHPSPAEAPVPPEIERWASFGGTWEVAELAAGSATVRLCRCDSGEEVSRITSSEPGFVAWAALQEAR
ncbi:flavin reductase family protein [Agromyces sp. MMS24-JH15]|uniref:flavin reductase family protein n=1 Tax=Agromyces sp. MMS24-JH15 TaxID=3243765 RepID=UPI003749B914